MPGNSGSALSIKNRSSARLRHLSFLVAGLAACAPPLRLSVPSQSRVASVPVAVPAEATSDSVTIQVRYFAHSPSVAVVAWRDAEPEFGLRTRILADGSWIAEHAIYVSASYLPVMPQAPRATIPSMPLQAFNPGRDADSCRFGACSPEWTMTARIEDAALRAVRDSVPVRFYEGSATTRSRPALTGSDPQPGLRELTITLHSGLISAYLATVDSVRSELQKRR